MLLENNAEFMVRNAPGERYQHEASPELEARIAQLENTVFKLQAIVDKEKALLRKAILLHLDMDAVYTQNLESH